MRNPTIYTASSLRNWDCDTNKNGRWIPARPLGWQGIRWLHNLKLAFLVLIGKYDVLDWED